MYKVFTKQKILQLSLVGAGPGDPELITLKGIRSIQAADVILYDALVNEELLNYAPKNIPKIYVGKRAGKHSSSQDEINRLIVENAYKYGHVVRLKGGDSFVFGRGHEELEYAESFGIKVNVIPGISSSISVPALQHIPLTKRGLNESFWVITGTTRKGELSSDIALAAQTNATIIILMGMSKLKEIQSIYTSYGKEKTAFAIIQNGSLKNEKTGFGEINQLEEISKKNNLGAPAIIIIGDVVKSHRKFKSITSSYFKQSTTLNFN